MLAGRIIETNKLENDRLHGRLQWSLLSEKRGMLMGFATLWVVTFHGAELYSDVSIPVLTLLLKRGNIGVEIFLIVSAIGLYFSMDQGTRIKGFYWKRIQRILIPYLILSSWFWAWLTIANGDSFISFLKNWSLVSFLTDGVTTAWYIVLIFCLYLVFPVIYKLLKNKKNWIFVLIGLDVVVNILVWYFWPSAYNYLEIALTRIPTFLCGCYIAPMVKEHKEIGRRMFVACVLGIIIGAGFILVLFSSGHKDLSIMAYRYTCFFIAFFLCVVLAVIVKSKYKVGMVLAGVGSVSLEVYLLHIFVRNILSFYSVGAMGNLLEKTIIYASMACGVILVSLGLKRLSKGKL